MVPRDAGARAKLDGVLERAGSVASAHAAAELRGRRLHELRRRQRRRRRRSRRLLGEQYPTLGAVLRGGELHRRSRSARRASARSTRSRTSVTCRRCRIPRRSSASASTTATATRNTRTAPSAPKYPSLFMRTPGSLVGHGEPICAAAGIRAARLRGRDRARDRQGGPPHRRGGRAGSRRRVHADATKARCATGCGTRSSTSRQGKNFERSGASGPWLVTADEIRTDRRRLHLTTRVNGELRQDDTTANLIFPFARLIDYSRASCA